MTATDWIIAVGTYVGPFIGILGAFWLYAKRQRDEEGRREAGQQFALFLELQAELSANQRIIAKSMASVDAILEAGEASEDPNDPIYDERFYVAPLFSDSWSALARTDAHRVLSPARLDQLFGYYSAISRLNWLLGRVQGFKFRRPILQEIRRTLDEVRGEVADSLDLHALASELAPAARARGESEQPPGGGPRASATEPGLVEPRRTSRSTT
jgi:hypothetical protein